MSFIKLPVSECSEILEHVPTCRCRYVVDPVTTDDVKLVDQRCLAFYLIPDKAEKMS